MRNPARVLNSLAEHSKDLNYKFERLYRILFNAEMFYVAYEKIHSKQGNMTRGTDGQTADQMSIARIERLIDKLKDESYKPHPSRRVYIPKKNGKQRPLGIPSFDDKLVQEVIRMILESIYEGSFENSSHGFRPRRSCHTALTKIQNTFTGTRWFIEGDIKGFFDNINHDVMIDVLKERIEDERFLRLIRKFLNAGYMERWKFHNTYSGTPQGGIVSPILANIYLDKLDKYMEEYRQSFDKGERRGKTTEESRMAYKISVIRKKLKIVNDVDEKQELLKALKEALKERARTITNGDQMDKNFRRIKYVRYADDFLISVIGSKEECIKIKADITKYLAQTLHLELSDEKTLITNAKRPAKFLGFNVHIRKVNVVRRNSKGFPSRPLNDKIVLSVTPDTMRKKLQEYDVVRMVTQNGTEKWKPKARRKLVNLELADIVSKFNSEIRGFYNYYSIANNCNHLHSFYYIMRFSMYKTFATKLRSTTYQVLKSIIVTESLA